MRLLFFTAAAAFALTAPAAADPPGAQAVLVERLGLMQLDDRCRLLEPGPRAALEAGAAQARGALLRAGWTHARLGELEAAVDGAARSRACADPRTQSAVADAREAYDQWARTSVMEFPGWSRAWVARRTTGPNGWRLSQTIDSNASFGVRDINGAQALSLVLNQTSATGARLILRDPRRGHAQALDLTRRVAYGLEAGAPATGSRTRTFPSTLRTERRPGARTTQTVFTFPNAAFEAMLALDPRETVVIEVLGARTTQRLLVEVGDIAPARAFLTLRAE
ncbi:MAG TPA: hypothetical protein PLK37_06375 [Terricaulis sp.]|nr:hypothetical protein [Terricaulis sp.]